MYTLLGLNSPTIVTHEEQKFQKWKFDVCVWEAINKKKLKAFLKIGMI